MQSEVRRYLVFPGQATAYKIGEMLIRRKRAEAEARALQQIEAERYGAPVDAAARIPTTAV